MALAHHLVLRLVDGRVVLATPEERCDGYHRMLRIGGRFGLLFFHLGTDHIHAVLACPEADVARFAHAIECSITRGTGRAVGFGHYYSKRVTDQGHLRSLAAYVLKQERKHGTTLDPRHLGSNGPDLVGGRLQGGAQRRLVRQMLPRLQPDAIERLLFGDAARVPLEDLSPAPAGLTGPGLERLLRAAAGAAIGRPAAFGSRGPAGAARRALLEIVDKTAVGETVDPARLLECSRSSVSRLRGRPVDVEVGRCVRWQVEFFVALAEAGSTLR